MLIIFRVIAAILAISVIAIGGHAEDKDQHLKQLSLHFHMKKPEGAKPYPAVMLVPGCSGFNSETFADHYERIQDEFVKLGFVTLRIDWLAVRNAANCFDVGFESVVGDIGIVADYLRKQDYVKKSALNVIGWSYGGSCALQALRDTQSRKSADVDAVVAYYPSCFIVNTWDSEVPVLALFGGADNQTPFADCENLIKNLKNPDRFTYRIYDAAHHQFDNPDLPPELTKSFGTVGYNEAAAKSSWSEVTNFLRK